MRVNLVLGQDGPHLPPHFSHVEVGQDPRFPFNSASVFSPYYVDGTHSASTFARSDIKFTGSEPYNQVS